MAADAVAVEPIPFRKAVDLALQHSGVMGIATLNQWRARKAYEEVRANYIPQLTIGSGLGYSYGFPLTLEGSAPSVVNFSSVQSFFNLSLRQFIKAAKIDCTGQARLRHSGYCADLRATRSAHWQAESVRRSSERGRQRTICHRTAPAAGRGQQA
jgi:hypothetical protein